MSEVISSFDLHVEQVRGYEFRVFVAEGSHVDDMRKRYLGGIAGKH